MQKIMAVIGTRPEAIKLVTVVEELKKYPYDVEIKVIVTAQHRQLLDQVLDLFKIYPDYDLSIMEPDQDLFSITNTVLTQS